MRSVWTESDTSSSTLPGIRTTRSGCASRMPSSFGSMPSTRSMSFTASRPARSSTFAAGVHRSVPVVVMFHGAFLGLVKAQLRAGLRTRRPLPYAARPPRRPVACNARVPPPWQLVSLSSLRGDRSVPAATQGHVPLPPAETLPRARRPKRDRRRGLPPAAARGSAGTAGTRGRSALRLRRPSESRKGHPPRGARARAAGRRGVKRQARDRRGRRRAGAPRDARPRARSRTVA